jgi:hypothetical protein
VPDDFCDLIFIQKGEIKSGDELGLSKKQLKVGAKTLKGGLPQ